MKASVCPLLAIWLTAGGVSQPAPELRRLVWKSEEGFTNIAAVRELSDGRVLLADRGDKRVVILSPRGRVLAEVGRQGQGPGEFAAPYSVLPFTDDSTIVTDLMLRRYLVIAPDLTIARTTSFPTTVGWAPLGKTDVGREEIVGPAGMPTSESPSVALVRLSLRTGETRAVLRLASAPPIPLEAGGRRIVVSPRFAADDAFALAPNGHVAVVRAADYHLEWFDSEGKLLAAGPSTPFDPVPIAAEERRGPFGATIPGPQTKPAFDPDGLHVDSKGQLWVARSERLGAANHRYDVFDARGIRRRTVALPSQRVLIGFGARSAYLVFTDPDGLQWLECYAP